MGGSVRERVSQSERGGSGRPPTYSSMSINLSLSLSLSLIIGVEVEKTRKNHPVDPTEKAENAETSKMTPLNGTSTRATPAVRLEMRRDHSNAHFQETALGE